MTSHTVDDECKVAATSRNIWPSGPASTALFLGFKISSNNLNYVSILSQTSYKRLSSCS